MSSPSSNFGRRIIRYDRVQATSEDDFDPEDPIDSRQMAREEAAAVGSQKEAGFTDEAGRYFSGHALIGDKEESSSEESTDKLENSQSFLDSSDNSDLISSEILLFLTMSYLLGMAFIETPFLMRFVGWSGVGVIFVVALITGYTAKLIIRNLVNYQRRHPYHFVSYVTQYESERDCLSIFLTVIYLLYLMLTAVTVLLEISKTILELTAANKDVTKFIQTSGSRVISAAVGFLLYPLTLFKSPKRYFWLSVPTLTMTVVAGLLLTTLLGNLEGKNPHTFKEIRYQEYAIWISTSVCNLVRFFGLHAVLSTVLMDMRDPDSAARVVGAGFLIPTIFVIVVAMMSYFAFGSNLLPRLYDVIDSTVVSQPNTFKAVSTHSVKGFMVFQLCFVYILNINALNLFFEKYGLSSDNKCHCCLVRLFTSIMVVLVAVASNGIEDALIFTNTFLAVAVCVIIPLVSSIDSKHSKPHEYILTGIVIFFIVICMFGTCYGLIIHTVYRLFGVNVKL
ncbi:uncharacterized protein LOC135695891 isoform X1 [Rhopilema esculentum]|uniref:uncharacterized protein LOC135695891 isoform X1 n=1 Tax=Rhopilema esculentum TaxID=499914 RepID=UPI0031D7DF77